MKIQLLAIAMSAAVIASCTNKTKISPARYSGEDLSGMTSIEKDPQTKQTTLKLGKTTPWELYGGVSADSINFSHELAKGETGGSYNVPVDGSVRWYFQLETPDGKAILAERHLPMEGGFNYRDLGGYRTVDGFYVKWGMVFRADDLHNLTTDDLEYLSSIPVTTVVDFRSQMEIDNAPDKLPSSVTNPVTLMIEPGNMSDVSGLVDVTEAMMDEFMSDMNRMLVTDSAIIQQYRRFFALLQRDENAPLIFHCSAGKDRTGMGAALFLASLGVDEHTIMQDYLLSNKYITAKYADYVKQYPQLKPLFEVNEKYLGAGLQAIRDSYGSIENYLTGPLGVDLIQMKKIYLY